MLDSSKSRKTQFFIDKGESFEENQKTNWQQVPILPPLYKYIGTTPIQPEKDGENVGRKYLPR